MGLADVAGDGEEQMGLAQAGAAVKKQRVIKHGRLPGHGQRRRVGKLVGAAYDEALKGVAGVNAGVGLQPPAVGLRAEHVKGLCGLAKKVGDDLGNIVGEAGGQRLLKKLAGCLHHKKTVLNGQRLGVFEPGIHRNGTQLIPQLAQGGVHQGFGRIHGIQSSSFLSLKKKHGCPRQKKAPSPSGAYIPFSV